jgi:hypothetical protein
MVCKQNTGDLYWFGPRNALRPVGEESYVLSCTKMLVVGVTREREELPSLKAWVEKVGVCDSAGDLARSKRVACSYLASRCYGIVFGWVMLFSSPLE